MCSCSPVMHMVCKASKLIVALAAVNTGLCAALGIDVVSTYLMAVKMPLDLVVGAAGVVSLVAFVMCCMGSSCKKCKA